MSISLRAALAEKDAENERLKSLLDRDQTGLAAALGAVVRECRGAHWITEGRGPYTWDDERYRAETGWFIGRVMDLATEALARSGSIANVAFGNTHTKAVKTFHELETNEACLTDEIERLKARVVELEASVSRGSTFNSATRAILDRVPKRHPTHPCTRRQWCALPCGHEGKCAEDPVEKP